MTCNLCNMLIDEKERAQPLDKDWYPDSEVYYIEYNEKYDRYDLTVYYDCGCASTSIINIQYCPLCGRTLE